jgi:hypothetical protein
MELRHSYALRIESFIFVGAASCRDWLTVAAGCRSYKKQGAIKSKVYYLIEYMFPPCSRGLRDGSFGMVFFGRERVNEDAPKLKHENK